MSIKSIPLSKVIPGMVLARVLEDDKGRTLCSAGTELNEKLITRLTRMEIPSVYIESDELLSEEKLTALKKEIEDRFVNIPEGSLMNELKSILLQRLELKKVSK
jgi:hypothetical protein